MSYTIIAAIGKNNELGNDNKLIWSLKEDLKFFKDKTTNHVIVMGRKTFESLPKLLPNRKHVVISRNNNFPDGVLVFNNIEELLKEYNDSHEEIFIIGGASIYKMFLDYCDKMYLTEIDETFDKADALFPTFDKSQWNREIISDDIEENDIHYKHILYMRK